MISWYQLKYAMRRTHLSLKKVCKAFQTFVRTLQQFQDPSAANFMFL